MTISHLHNVCNLKIPAISLRIPATWKTCKAARPGASVAIEGYFGYLGAMIRMFSHAVAWLLFASAISAAAQTNDAATDTASLTNRVGELALSEQMRAECIAGRRSICGKILQIFPDGILVESGYTNLVRGTLTKSWLVPGTVVASRADNLVESREPGATCIGTVFLTDLPRGKPHQYDYVIIAGYPTGEHTYTSVGTIQKTVRRFSANLDRAVKMNIEVAGRQAAK
jgi:hypothetical protein